MVEELAPIMAGVNEVNELERVLAGQRELNR